MLNGNLVLSGFDVFFSSLLFLGVWAWVLVVFGIERCGCENGTL